MLYQVHALAASKDERHIEGNVWLIKLLGDAYVAAADMVHTTDSIEAGWWVVDAMYYYLAQRSPRGYMLKSAQRVLVVNHLIRLPYPIKWDEPSSRRGGFRRACQTENDNPLRLLLDKDYYRLESSMSAVR